MVGSTVGSRWQVLVLYGTVARVVSAAATVRVLMRGIGAASCPMRVPYRTVRLRCLVTVVLVLVTRTLVSHSFRDKDQLNYGNYSG